MPVNCAVAALEGEDVSSLWRRFKKASDRSGILTECWLRESYTKPGEARRQKTARARQRFRKSELRRSLTRDK